ncbi:helix-turn-helix domain-containing protein [Paenibacillus sp. GCM10023248]|uniref:AraC family transcriptional regulator n=1 Tax=Bacillales TaxID=1385 RepID=UPI002378A764|nr:MULTISPECIES: AraC family transcriptional regulator [Bacillales]MDD9271348.1 helix-turn-helix domain-containing protein [Paenibacillus sp. MAHUQ-63]MDR6881529.1 AraC-like DNA-binding protein/mannose-6-phosphate isomerase-like protein (cupin superfamily) [Bacillus sp. 3255]
MLRAKPDTADTAETADTSAVYYAIDDYTNHFLKEYPVHCEYRITPLIQPQLHAHNGYEIYFVLQGSGSYVVGDRLLPLHAGSLTVIHPNVLHRPYHGHSPEFHRYVLSLDESYLEKLHGMCQASDLSIARMLAAGHPDASHYFLTPQQLVTMQGIFAQLELHLQERTPLYELEVLKIISEFFLELFRLQAEAATQDTKRDDPQLIGDVLAYLIAHYQESILIEDLVLRFPVSRSQLFTAFKETTGTTIGQFLTEYRLNQAKRLLMETDRTVTDIASATGFGDISHFFHLFKKATGITPKQYRIEAYRRRGLSN